MTPDGDERSGAAECDRRRWARGATDCRAVPVCASRWISFPQVGQGTAASWGWEARTKTADQASL